jgi:class 3 adenylate cyclase
MTEGAMSTSQIVPASRRVLTPAESRLQPFPRRAAMVLGAAFAVAIPTAPKGGFGSSLFAIALLVGLGACIVLSGWLELRIYRRLLAERRLTRMALSAVMPLVLFVASWPATFVLGIGGALLGDNGMIGVCVALAMLWAASSAFGSMVVVFIDVLISAIFRDFRSRVQLAVMSLLGISVVGATGTYVLGHAAADALVAALQRGVTAGEMTADLDLAGRHITGAELLELLQRPHAIDVITAALVGLVFVLMLPAIVSACGKLADAVMERLNPLADAIDEVGRGRLDVEVEEGGSRDFVRISQGFNRMVESLGAMIADLDAKNRDLSELHGASSRFVPFQFLELLHKKSIREIERGDQTALEIAVLFSDIRGFTTLAERIGPAETFAFVNRYVAHMEPAVHGARGFINDFAGDGIMALFNTGPDAAVRAALGMTQALAALNRELVAEGREPIAVGIGINTGQLMLGTIGGSTRLACTVIGDPANVAARIEGMTKVYGSTVLLSDSTVRGLPEGYRVREVDRVQAVGKREAAAVYELLDAEPEEALAQKLGSAERFTAGLEAYRSGDFRAALVHFEACAAAAPLDKTAALYVTRCRELGDHPPASWDGVTRLERK